MNTPQTANPDWGFFGTIRHHAELADAWYQALSAIAAATGCPAAAVRAFLDSRHRRHFADDVANSLIAGVTIGAAITAAIIRWIDSRSGRQSPSGWAVRGEHPCRLRGETTKAGTSRSSTTIEE
jgi:hypothetical protein